MDADDGGASDSQRIDFAYRTCYGRSPSASEAEVALKYFQRQLKADAKTAWARTARVLINLDEFVTRE